MSGGFPIGRHICNGQAVGLVNSTGTLCPGVSNNTMGAWTQISSSTPNDAILALIFLNSTDTAHNSGEMAFNLGIGASGSQKILCQQLALDFDSTNLTYCYNAPLAIPAGSSIWGQAQEAIFHSATGVAASLLLFDGSFDQSEGFAGIDSLGYVAATTQGTTMPANLGGATFTAWTQLSASTPHDYVGLFLIADSLQGLAPNNFFVINVGWGPSGQQQIAVPNFCCQMSSPFYMHPLNGLEMYPVQIPAGSAVWAQTNSNSSGAACGVVAYGIYK